MNACVFETYRSVEGFYLKSYNRGGISSSTGRGGGYVVWRHCKGANGVWERVWLTLWRPITYRNGSWVGSSRYENKFGAKHGIIWVMGLFVFLLSFLFNYYFPLMERMFVWTSYVFIQKPTAFLIKHQIQPKPVVACLQQLIFKTHTNSECVHTWIHKQAKC